MRRFLILAAFLLLAALTITAVGAEEPSTSAAAGRPAPSSQTSSSNNKKMTEVNASSSRCRVSGPESQRDLVEQLAELCEPSARTVDAAWGTTWARGLGQRTRVEVAGDLESLAEMLNREDTKGLADTAAVTVGPDNKPADAVFVNGLGFEDLSDLGREVVLTHELVHVAARATGDSAAPTWLEEGYADYVAYRHTDLAPRQIAEAALDAPLPRKLPNTDAFDAAGPDAAVAYGRSWAAAMLLAEHLGGDAALKAFYEQAAHDGIDAALREAGFSDEAAFISAWRTEIEQLRGSPQPRES